MIFCQYMMAFKDYFWGKVQSMAENPLPISVIDKIKVINKIELAYSESDFGFHG